MSEIRYEAPSLMLAILLMIVLTAGCRTAPEVGMRMILPPGAAVMDVPKDKVLLMAAPVSQPLPVLPAGLPGTREVSLCIELIVDEVGAVRSAVPIYELPECRLQKPGSIRGSSPRPRMRSWNGNSWQRRFARSRTEPSKPRTARAMQSRSPRFPSDCPTCFHSSALAK